ncbi:MAG: HEPN domain-containing protein [Alphaproteobacteria bacterium]|nr:HEPN domain-containing protein [Alphaproteobacteria bacterium]
MTQSDRHLADIRAIVEALRAGAALPRERLDALAHRFLASSREGRGRIDPRVFAETIRSELTGRFVHQGRAPDQTQVTRMLAAALRRARDDIEDRTHFIPCRLFDGGGPPGLAVGPVAFHETTGFRAARADAIAADPEFSALVERDFAPWGWTAEVTVRGCDRIVSRERALKAVDGALDILRLYAGADRARALGRAGAPGLPAVVPAGLWADSTGRFHPVRAEAPAPADGAALLHRLHAGDGRDWLDRAGETLRPLADPSLGWPLAARFREAGSWFGEGVTESFPAARIPHFVTAIERAVVAGDHAELWRTVVRRAAVLAAAAEGGDVADWFRRAGGVYQIRSQIVHGAMSPFAPEAGAAAPQAAALARAVLQGALGFFETLGLTRARVSASLLEGEFRKLERRYPWPNEPAE